MGRIIVLDLPDELAARAEYLARLSQRHVDNVLADRLSFLLPPLDVPSEQLEYSPVSNLSDDQILALAQSQMDPIQNARLRQLQKQRESESLSPAEQAELLSLWQIYEVGSLHKAQALAESVVEPQEALPSERELKERAASPRLPNLEKLYHVPVIALRKLLERHVPGRRLGHLRQDDLVAEADRLAAITVEDVDRVYESYRYGRRLSFYLYLLPAGLPELDFEAYQDALDGSAAPDEAGPGIRVADDGPGGTGASSDRILLVDEDRLGDVWEIRFRYYDIHRFLNAGGEPDRVFQTYFGLLWLDVTLGWVAILSPEERVNQRLTQALSRALKAIPAPASFPEELIDKHFSIEKIKRVSHYDPGTGVRQSISGQDLWKKFEGEILAREQRYARPASLYDEELAEGVTSGLGVTAKKGKIFFTKTLPITMVRAWALQRLPDLVRDVKALQETQPDGQDHLLEAIKRARLPSDGKAALMSITRALLQSERESQKCVRLPQSALVIHDALAGKYVDPYLRTHCGECEESAELCPQCAGRSFHFGQQQVTCKECGAMVSDHRFAALRCMNGHVTGVPLAEGFCIAPNHWLQKRMVQIFEEIGHPWSEEADYFHIEGYTLYRLRSGAVETEQLPQVVQN